MHHLRVFVLTMVALLASCVADPGGETTSRNAQALLVPGLTPVPCRSLSNPQAWIAPFSADDADILWDGGQVELLAADALVQCNAAWSVNGNMGQSDMGHDRYLKHVLDLMFQVVPMAGSPGGPGGSLDLRAVEDRWADLRGIPQFNCDPVTHAPMRPVGLNLDGGVVERMPWFGVDPSEWSAVPGRANVDLRTAGMNLCIAQYLRRASPGASAGETLLMNDADQRWLLEVIRERAQIAMLQYAALGTVFSRFPSINVPSTLGSLNPVQTIPLLEWWGLNCGTNSIPSCDEASSPPGYRLAAMGRDFATAVQLHIMVTEELAELFARSGSARHPRGGTAPTRPDDIWGAGSWKQRTAALLFGGDPLAIEPGGPWVHPLDVQSPSGSALDSWPGSNRNPYFRTEIAEPQVRALLSLARRYKQVRVKSAELCAGDAPLSAQALFDVVEANLRKDTCAVTLPNGACETNLANLMPGPQSTLADMVLWNQHRITRSHASTLAKHLSEALSYCPQGAELNDARMGPLNLDGTVELTGGEIVVAPATTFNEPPLQDGAPKYTRFMGLRLPAPGEIVPKADSGDQGFLGCGVGGCAGGYSPVSEGKRRMGAISALSMVRRAVMASLDYLASVPASMQAQRLNDYFAQSKEILTLISGAIGDDGLGVRPWVVNTDADPLGSIDSLDTLYFQGGTGEYRSVWQVDGAVAADDTFWQPGQTYFVCSVESPVAGNLAVHPTASILGFTISNAVFASFFQGLCGQAIRLPVPSYGGPARYFGYALTRGPSPTGFTLTYPTLVAVAPSGQVRLLASQVRLFAGAGNAFVRQGQAIGTSGALGAFVKKQSEHHEVNPVEPRYDGFGLRTDWVPPLSAELVGGAPGETSAAHFLALAKTSSSEATAAVEKAVDELLATQQDEVAEATAAAQSAAGIQEEMESLCGPGGACAQGGTPISFVQRKPDPTWYPSAPTMPAGYPGNCPEDPQGNAQIKLALDCVVYRMFDNLLQMDIKVAQPVLDEIDAPAAPAFAGFSGGKLQSALIKQWGALRAPDEKFKSLVAAKNAALGQIDVAETVLATLQEKVRQNCGGAGFVKGLVSTIGGGGLGAFNDQADKCQDLQADLGIQKKKVIAAHLDSFASVAGALQGAIDTQVAIQLTSAEMDTLVNDARLKSARHKLEAQLASINAKTSFGLSRRYRAYDMWRAKALIENSRRYALAARRGIEARNVVNLSTLTQPEAFVTSPATWADEIYSYDLSLPSAVGLVTGEKQPGGIYANKVKDYVTNLEGFASGYAVNRPSAVAKDDIDILTLPGLTSDTPILVDSISGEVCQAPAASCVTRYADRGDWLLHCKGSSTWVHLDPSLPASDACGYLCAGCSPPIKDQADVMRLEFTLDPWGRLNGSIAGEPYQKRFNARWGLFAVNVVGTGVKDCKVAADPLGCYSQGFLPFNMTHVGPAWVTDYDEIWRLHGVPLGRVEGGKALAAELWLDPLKDGWSTNYISAVKRSEFEVRPLGGAYELEVALGPEVQIDRIERIQVLIGSSYWVKQQ